jgi:hypothetical protein
MVHTAVHTYPSGLLATALRRRRQITPIAALTRGRVGGAIQDLTTITPGQVHMYLSGLLAAAPHRQWESTTTAPGRAGPSGSPRMTSPLWKIRMRCLARWIYFPGLIKVHRSPLPGPTGSLLQPGRVHSPLLPGKADLPLLPGLTDLRPGQMGPLLQFLVPGLHNLLCSRRPCSGSGVLSLRCQWPLPSRCLLSHLSQ